MKTGDDVVVEENALPSSSSDLTDNDFEQDDAELSAFLWDFVKDDVDPDLDALCM